MRDVARVTYVRDPVHHVVRVLGERVVHRGREIRPAAVVVDAETAADVDVLETGAHELELRVYVRQLVDRILHATDVLQLAARMTVNQLQTVEHVALFQHVEQLENLGDEQAELGLFTRGGAPTARTLTEQLYPDADARPHLVGVGVLEDEAELFKVLHHGNDGATEFGRERDRLDVAVVLEAIADDQPVGRVLRHRHHGEQLRLGADLQPETELLPVAVDLLHHEPLLVHLDREHGNVAVLVVVLRDGLCERPVYVLEAMRKDVGETDDHRSRQVTRLETFDHLEEVDDVRALCVGTHDDVARVVHGEVALPPCVHIVEVERVLDPPRLSGVELAVAVAGAFRVFCHVS